MVFDAKTGYTVPILDPDELRAEFRHLQGTLAKAHLITIKTCDSPRLLARAVRSVRGHLRAPNLQLVVVDDSSSDIARQQNLQIAGNNGAFYACTKGELSLVRAFSNHLAGC